MHLAGAGDHESGFHSAGKATKQAPRGHRRSGGLFGLALMYVVALISVGGVFQPGLANAFDHRVVIVLPVPVIPANFGPSIGTIDVGVVDASGECVSRAIAAPELANIRGSLVALMLEVDAAFDAGREGARPPAYDWLRHMSDVRDWVYGIGQDAGHANIARWSRARIYEINSNVEVLALVREPSRDKRNVGAKLVSGVLLSNGNRLFGCDSRATGMARRACSPVDSGYQKDGFERNEPNLTLSQGDEITRRVRHAALGNEIFAVVICGFAVLGCFVGAFNAQDERWCAFLSCVAWAGVLGFYGYVLVFEVGVPL